MYFLKSNINLLTLENLIILAIQKGFIAYPRKELTDHILKEDNLALATMRQIAGTKQTCVVMLTKNCDDR